MSYLQTNETRLESCYRDAHVELDCRRASLSVDSRSVRLTRKECQLLAMLAQNAGEIIPRDVLLACVWGYNKEVRTRTLDVHVRRLRKKLGSYGEQYIETIFGVGYRFQPYREGRPFALYAPELAVVA